MIKPINSSLIRFQANKQDYNSETGEYKDPLMHWPIRGAAFTNEVGEALRPLIGDLATLSWAPALLYIGADIYDKYKNNNTEYNPDPQRGVKQAVFQGMASILLPLVAVKGGQNIFSGIGLFTKDKMTYNTKEQVNKIAETFVANGNMRKFQGKDKECIKEFCDRVMDNVDYKKQIETRNPFKKFWFYSLDKISDFMNFNPKERVNNYAQETIKELIQLRKQAFRPTDEFKNSWEYTFFKSSIENGETPNVAVKSLLIKKLNKQNLKGSFVKTIGGFIALGLLIKPIDNFVENVLIGKYIDPKLAQRNKTNDKALV